MQDPRSHMLDVERKAIKQHSVRDVLHVINITYFSGSSMTASHLSATTLTSLSPAMQILKPRSLIMNTMLGLQVSSCAPPFSHLSLGLPGIDIANHHVGVDLAVGQNLAHPHEEDLVLVCGPLEHVVPQKEGVSFDIVLQGQLHEAAHLGELGVLGPAADRELLLLLAMERGDMFEAIRRL